MRWGEARHPGPSSNEDFVILGTTNPGGLRSKESLAIEQGAGIWSYSETQLSQVTQASCSKTLKAMARRANRHLKVHYGAPAALRQRSSWAGTWSGVLVTSDYSSKTNIPWPPDVWSSGRVVATQHFIEQQVITLVTLYGLPRGPAWPKAAELTTGILEFITSTFILGYSGLVAVVGDFNFGPTELPIFDTWRAHDWHSAQDLAAQWWSRPKCATCKGAAERDLI